jgi:formyl-CoA transferase
MELVGSATIPAGAVMDTRELADDKSFQARGIRQTMKHPEVGDYVMSGWPVRFGGRPPEIGPAPLLGQHGEQVLAEWLRYDAARIADLKNNEVLY